MIMLNSRQIAELIKENNLIEGYIDLDKQLTPNGFDLTVSCVFGFDTQGSLDFSNKERIIPECPEIFAEKQKKEDKFGWWVLEQGIYKIKTNEIVSLPNNLIALAFTRTSLLRMGVFTQHGVWDAGFKGKGEFVLTVGNPQGVRLKQNARITQLVFQHITEVQQGYNGIHQNTR